MSIFFHEQLYRSSEAMAKFKDFSIVICGAGALGANLTETLARSGFQTLKVIDFDRIEEHNLSTQPYLRSDVGASKVKVLANTIYRAVGVQIQTDAKKLTGSTVKRSLRFESPTDRTPHLVIDAFDNSVSRQLLQDFCRDHAIPCLHAGLAADYAEVIWNDQYRVPSDANDDVCDYPLARKLVMLTVAIAAESTTAFAISGQHQSVTLTLKDLKIMLL